MRDQGQAERDSRCTQVRGPPGDVKPLVLLALLDGSHKVNTRRSGSCLRGGGRRASSLLLLVMSVCVCVEKEWNSPDGGLLGGLIDLPPRVTMVMIHGHGALMSSSRAGRRSRRLPDPPDTSPAGGHGTVARRCSRHGVVGAVLLQDRTRSPPPTPRRGLGAHCSLLWSGQ